jgi:hypothetical protein
MSAPLGNDGRTHRPVMLGGGRHPLPFGCHILELPPSFRRLHERNYRSDPLSVCAIPCSALIVDIVRRHDLGSTKRGEQNLSRRACPEKLKFRKTHSSCRSPHASAIRPNRARFPHADLEVTVAAYYLLPHLRLAFAQDRSSIRRFGVGHPRAECFIALGCGRELRVPRY